MAMNIVPWTEKYRPERSNQVCGNSLEFDQVLEYGRQSKNVLLHGPSGTGKSSAVRVLLKNVPKDSKLILDAKSRASESTQHLIHKLTVFSMRKTSYKQRFVLVDEVDSIRINDQKMFIRPLTKDIGVKKNDDRGIIFLFICNRIDRVSEFIIRHCVVVNYNSLEFDLCQDYLENICINEKVVYDLESLNYIFYKIGQDMRKMVSTMQYLSLLMKRIHKDDLEKIDKLNKIEFIELFDKLFDNDNILEITNELYDAAYSVITLCIMSLKYHKLKKCLSNDYVIVLANIAHDSRTTENTWFLLYRLISESPLFIKLSKDQLHNNQVLSYQTC